MILATSLVKIELIVFCYYFFNLGDVFIVYIHFVLLMFSFRIVCQAQEDVTNICCYPFCMFFNGCCCHIYALKLRSWFLFFSLFFFEIVCQAHVGVTICLLLLFFYCSCSSYGIAVIIHIGYFVVFL